MARRRHFVSCSLWGVATYASFWIRMNIYENIKEWFLGWLALKKILAELNLAPSAALNVPVLPMMSWHYPKCSPGSARLTCAGASGSWGGWRWRRSCSRVESGAVCCAERPGTAYDVLALSEVLTVDDAVIREPSASSCANEIDPGQSSVTSLQAGDYITGLSMRNHSATRFPHEGGFLDTVDGHRLSQSVIWMGVRESTGLARTGGLTANQDFILHPM